MDLAVHAASQVKITYIESSYCKFLKDIMLKRILIFEFNFHLSILFFIATLKMIRPTITDMSDVSDAVRFRNVKGTRQNNSK